MSDHATWAAEMERGLAGIQEQGGGAVLLSFVRLADVPGIMWAAEQGNPYAWSVLSALNQTLLKIQQAPRRLPMLCACCPRPVRRDNFAITVALPAGPSAAHALAIAVCKRCGPDPDSLQRKSIEAFRQIWPDGRVFEVTHPEGGRA